MQYKEQIRLRQFRHYYSIEVLGLEKELSQEKFANSVLGVKKAAMSQYESMKGKTYDLPEKHIITIERIIEKHEGKKINWSNFSYDDTASMLQIREKAAKTKRIIQAKKEKVSSLLFRLVSKEGYSRKELAEMMGLEYNNSKSSVVAQIIEKKISLEKIETRLYRLSLKLKDKSGNWRVNHDYIEGLSDKMFTRSDFENKAKRAEIIEKISELVKQLDTEIKKLKN